MKKYFAVTFVLACILSLSGCIKSSHSNGVTNDSSWNEDKVVNEDNIKEQDRASMALVLYMSEVLNDDAQFDLVEIGSDRSYVAFDTNPLDDEYFDTSDLDDIAYNLLVMAGAPESIHRKIGNTRALDGVQTVKFKNESNEYIEVSWSYHPDTGMELLIEKIK